MKEDGRIKSNEGTARTTKMLHTHKSKTKLNKNNLAVEWIHALFSFLFPLRVAPKIMFSSIVNVKQHIYTLTLGLLH